MAAELLRRLLLAALAYGEAWYIAGILAPLWQMACAPMRAVLGQ